MFQLEAFAADLACLKRVGAVGRLATPGLKCSCALEKEMELCSDGMGIQMGERVSQKKGTHKEKKREQGGQLVRMSLHGDGHARPNHMSKMVGDTSCWAAWRWA